MTSAPKMGISHVDQKLQGEKKNQTDKTNNKQKKYTQHKTEESIKLIIHSRCSSLTTRLFSCRELLGPVSHQLPDQPNGPWLTGLGSDSSPRAQCSAWPLQEAPAPARVAWWLIK